LIFDFQARFDDAETGFLFLANENLLDFLMEAV
jgi:hypothetical protein